MFLRLRLSLILTLSLSVICRQSYARILAIGSDSGLPDKYITAICKDVHGLMWVCTRQGLCTYDGYGFEPLKASMLSGTSINKLVYDARRDLLWLGTNKGLFTVHCRSLKVQQEGLADNGIEKRQVTGLYLNRDGRLIAAYRTGEIGVAEPGKGLALLGRLNSTNSNVPFFANGIQAIGSSILVLHVSPEQGPYQLDIRDGAIQKATPSLHSKSFYYMASKGDTLLIEPNGERLLLENTRAATDITPVSLQQFRHEAGIVDMQFTTDSTMLVLSKPCRLYKIHLGKGSIDTITSDVFTGRLATCFYIDEQHNIWLGTNKGLVSITEDKAFFDRALVQVPPVSIRSLVMDEGGNMYAGTYAGLFGYSVKNKTWQKLGSNIPYAMLNARGNYIYFVGEERLMHRIDKRTGKVETDFYIKKQMPEDELRQAYTLASDEKGLIWIGTSFGLVTYDRNTNILMPYEGEHMLPVNMEVRYIRSGKDNKLWVCSKDGLYEIDKQKGVVWHVNTATKPALSGNNVNYMDEDKVGRLWLCTDGGGINIISKDRRHVTVLKKEDGLSDNTTYNLMWQGDERVWISTFNGLSTYNVRTNTFYNYYVSDGLSSNEFNHNAYLLAPDGRMHFGTINGLNSFYPTSVPAAMQKSQLFTSSISKWDNNAKATVNIYPSDTGSTIEVNPLDHSLAFNLALTDYSNPENNVFRYRILGLFDDWISLNNPHVLRLDGLAAGNYVLEIMALDNRGMPALNILRYHIEVGQAFYKAWWFYLSLFLIASALTWFFFYLRIQNLRKVQHIRQQISSDLHDEVGSLLTRITMTSDNLSFSDNSESEKESKVRKIASLSRTAVSSMSDILWAIDGRNDYTGNLGDRMREHAEEMLLPLHIDMHFDMQVNQKMSISSELRQQLYLIYKEAINNIVKHSKATEVKINYTHNERGLRLRIVNDGYIAKDKPSTKGQGLNNIDMRAKRVKALANTGAEGNEFIVEVVA